MNFARTIDRTFRQDSINSINLEYVQQKQNARLQTRLENFEKVLQRVYHRIDICSDYQQNFCFFRIPEYIYGLPIYSVKSCAAYIMKKLMANGFRCKFFVPNLLYVYWYYKETNPALLAPGMPINDKQLKNKLDFPDNDFLNTIQPLPNAETMKSAGAIQRMLGGLPEREPEHRGLDVVLAQDRLKNIPTRTKSGTVNLPLPPINQSVMFADVDSDSESSEMLGPALAQHQSNNNDFTISLSDRTTGRLPNRKSPSTKRNPVVRSTKNFNGWN